MVLSRKPVVVTDKKGYAIIEMAPGPNCNDWKKNTDAGADLCEEGRKGESRGFAAAEIFQRRGNFASGSAASTHGNGRLVCRLLLLSLFDWSLKHFVATRESQTDASGADPEAPPQQALLQDGGPPES